MIGQRARETEVDSDCGPANRGRRHGHYRQVWKSRLISLVLLGTGPSLPIARIQPGPFTQSSLASRNKDRSMASAITL